MGNKQTNITDQMIRIEAGPFISGLTPQQQLELAGRYAINVDLFQTLSHGQIDVASFYIDKYPVTNARYKAFVDATGYRPPLPWVDRGYPAWLAQGPVTGVNHEDARAYAQWAGKRLATAGQWEKAARGGDGRLWPWGNDWRAGACMMDGGGADALFGYPAPVGEFSDDRSPYGVMDMAGNVSEWVDDGLTMMGGNFTLSEPYQFLCAMRTLHPPLNGYVGYVGFRCVVQGSNDSSETLQIKRSSHGYVSVAERPSAPASPDASRYRTSLIRLLPIRDLDPTRQEYPYSMDVYLPREPGEQDPVLPWRVEVSVPYLPTDRFCIWAENYPRQAQSRPRFSSDHSTVELVRSVAGEVEARIEMRGGLDFVDVDHQVANTSGEVIACAQNVCFQAINAPCFRDHDGKRTFIMTDRGFTKVTQVDHFRAPRLWFQPFFLGASTMQPRDDQRPANPTGPAVTGPLIATMSRDGQWVIAPTVLTGPVVRMLNNREYSCLHCDPESQLQPGASIRIVQRIYFLRGNLDDLLSRWQSDTQTSE